MKYQLWKISNKRSTLEEGKIMGLLWWVLFGGFFPLPFRGWPATYLPNTITVLLLYLFLRTVYFFGDFSSTKIKKKSSSLNSNILEYWFMIFYWGNTLNCFFLLSRYYFSLGKHENSAKSHQVFNAISIQTYLVDGV